MYITFDCLKSWGYKYSTGVTIRCFYLQKSIEIGKFLISSRNALSPVFFLQMLDLIFQSFYQDVRFELLVQLFLIGFYLFCSKTGKKISIRFYLVEVIVQMISAIFIQFQTTLSKSSLSVSIFSESYHVLFSNPKYHQGILRY